MGSTTIPRSPAFPLVLTRYKLLEIERYRLPLFGITFVWQSEIQRWHPPEEFVDVQLRGPYKRWVHTHRFREEHGATIIEDEVQYALPYWPLGELVYPLVRLPLGRIFRYRQQAIRRYLLPESESP
jgi:ligand-binding SRPBCC domain-containing protein